MATIYHQVWIDASVEKVYEVISSAEGVSRWWDEQTEKKTDTGLVWEHSPGSEHGVVQMKVLERTSNERVKWECISTHKECVPASAWTGTQLTFDLVKRKECEIANAAWSEAIPAQTVLDFRHSGWHESSKYLGFCNFAWGDVLQNLKQICEAE